MTDFDALLDKLEPAAVKGNSEWPEVAQFSMAVSLKRIADALWGDEKTTGIVLLLNHIEANGRQN